MAVDIFRNPTMKLPKSDKQIIRVDMEEDQIQGQKQHLPGQMKSEILSIQHVSSKK
jgi:hypothetical protein